MELRVIRLFLTVKSHNQLILKGFVFQTYSVSVYLHPKEK